MKVTKSTQPFDHYVVENILPLDLYELVRERAVNWPKPDREGTRQNRAIVDTDVPTYRGLDTIYDPELYDAIKSRMIPILKDHLDFEVTDEHSLLIEYNAVAQGYAREIHTDAKFKVATLVWYLSNDGSGTMVYDKNKENPIQVPWTPNGGLFFERTETSWHSYHSSRPLRETINIIIGV